MLIEHLSRRLRERDAQALTRRRRTAQTPCAPRVTVDGREMLAFCSNDYLGLASHPALAEALAEGARRFGTGSGASHLVSGHTAAHAALEDTLAAWFAPHIPGAQALSFCTGYMANLALLTALGDAQATLFADKLNHASLVDGALLARAPLQRYAHGRLDMLQAQLARCETPVKLIVTDAVFSMDGDLADLPALLALAEAHDAWLVVDDAHGFGVLGERGRGSLAHFGLRSERFVYMGTLGKAAGVGGAFVAAHPVVIAWLLQTARPYVYTTAAPPALAHAALCSLALIEGADGDARRARLRAHVTVLREALDALAARHPGRGWRLADSATAIQPLIVGDNDTALALAAALDAQGLWVPAIRPPTVPVGSARLRITLSAAHEAADIGRLLMALARAAAGMRGCFVTGTDTGIGKTQVSAALLLWLQRRGVAAAGFKPVAAGTQLIAGRLVNEDVSALRAASAIALSDAEVGPLQFEAACAPHIAAALEGRRIERALLRDAAARLAGRAEFVLVEGVGGFAVPLGTDWDTADLAQDLALPVLLVVGLRLGCLSHALLTAEAVARRGLPLAGWVANRIAPDMPHCGDNVATLKHELARRHGAACLGDVPWLPGPTPDAVSAHFDDQALAAALRLG